MRRIVVCKSLLWVIVGAAAAIAVLRFWRGLGATTALSDLTPWGFWIGFDVMGGVALAAGGFVLAGTVYVLHLEHFRPIVRPAVLTAFLGYLAVVGGLLFDLGLPWHIWHVIVFWNPHSPLFEVGWCVILYTVVLALELGPVVLESTRHPVLQRTHHLLKKTMVPLVILGIMLSTLHQSSLGSLFLIMPHRLHPLWYTPILPIQFFVSAVGLALLMVPLESLVSSYLYEKEPEMDLLPSLGRAAAWVLLLYGLLRLGDVVISGKTALIWAGGFSSWLFAVEMSLSFVIPSALLFLPCVRMSRTGLLAAAATGVAGFVMNRLDVGGLATVEATQTRYVPLWTEVMVSLGVVSAAILAYFFVAERFHLFRASSPRLEQFRSRPLHVDPATGLVPADLRCGGLASYSLMAVVGVALAAALVPKGAFGGLPVTPQRTIGPTHGPKMLIDGNRAEEAVWFNHDGHVDIEGGRDSCGHCHHLSKDGPRATGCTECHQDMRLSTSIFDHGLHAERLHATQGCAACHDDIDVPKNLAHARPCTHCHTRMVSPDSRIALRDPTRFGVAAGYVTAMHGLCIACHQQMIAAQEIDRTDLGECAGCHQPSPAAVNRVLPDERGVPY